MNTDGRSVRDEVARTCMSIDQLGAARRACNSLSDLGINHDSIASAIGHIERTARTDCLRNLNRLNSGTTPRQLRQLANAMVHFRVNAD